MTVAAAAVPARRAAERLLLIAPHGSYRTAPFLAAARRIGVEVLVASEGKHSLAAQAVEGLHIPLHEPSMAMDRILQAARAQPFCGIVATDDSTTELAAAVAQALELPHNPPAAARLARRKDLARAHLQRAGLRVPRHWCVDLRRPLAAQLDGVDFPCVVKPVALSASRGVIRADDPGQLRAACARIRHLLEKEPPGPETAPRHTLLIERFIAGRELAVEGLLEAGRFRLLALFDKPDPLDGPYFEETYYITPSRLAAATQARIAAEVGAVCAAYGLREGPVHAECRLNADGVWILEVAARTIGGLCGRLFRFGTGYGLEDLVLLHALGRPPVSRPAPGAAGVLMIPTPQAGILRRVEGILAARRVAYVEDVTIQVREGYELVPLPEGSSYLGFIFARAPTAGEAEAALREAHARLNIVVAPLWRGVAST